MNGKRQDNDRSEGRVTPQRHAESTFDRDDFDVGETSLFETLRVFDGSASPDLSRRIMGRLGYMRVPARVARRRRIVRWAGRCACLALAGIAITLGVKAYQASPDARRPAEITIPAAISSDLLRQQDRFGPVIRLIQQGPLGLGAADVDAEPSLSPKRPAEPHEPHEIDEELNRSAIAPVRWV